MTRSLSDCHKNGHVFRSKFVCVNFECLRMMFGFFSVGFFSYLVKISLALYYYNRIIDEGTVKYYSVAAWVGL